MVLFKNATLSTAKETVTKNAEGTKVLKFDYENPLETFRADVQPANLTEAQVTLYGINSRNANVKKCFFDWADGQTMCAGNRVKVVYDYGDVEYYNIQPVNKWREHHEAILTPVENE